MRKADQFVELYNQLSAHLAELTGDDRAPFYALIERSRTISRVVRREEVTLKKYGDLRNLIVHGPNYPRELLAEPTDETVAEFEQIVQRIIAPTRLDAFAQHLRLFRSQDLLESALHHMNDHDFSQVIVRDGQRLSLLTAEGITKWLQAQAKRNNVNLANVTVEDALHYDLPNNFQLMRRNDTVDAAEAVFATAIEQGHPRLFAIIVTQNGRLNEAPLGIVTPWDLLEVE